MAFSSTLKFIKEAGLSKIITKEEVSQIIKLINNKISIKSETLDADTFVEFLI